jgi:hypothetical protein
MDLYSKLLDFLYITEEDVASFRDDNPGFCGFDSSRVSRLLIAQLTWASRHRIFNSFSVTDVIQQLEGVGRNGCAQHEISFKHLPLKGFRKAHFFDARFLVKNLVNHWGLEFEDSSKFDTLCAKVSADEDKKPSAHGWQGRLASEFTIGGYKEKARQKKLTGEWVIFSKQDDLNYYLCIAKHSSTKEEDEKIYALIKAVCAHEYPFLFSK